MRSAFTFKMASPTAVFAVSTLLATALFVVCSADYPYKEKYTTQFVDHFNYKNKATFPARYLISEQFHSTNTLFFYTGNEGAIEGFWENSGFVFEFAKEVGPLIVFAEHRYYGKSLPFGSASFTGDNIGYLSVEQALADYAVLLTQLKLEYKIDKVVAFGGSYGGMLSAYIRFKYPNLVDAALAASAPIYLVAGETDSNAFFEGVTKDFASVNAVCPVIVRRAISRVIELAKQGEAGLKQITDSFQLCKPLTSDKVEHLLGWVRNSFTSLAMVDYPYPASFLAPLPAYPVNVSCKYLIDSQSTDVMRGLAEAAGLFYNGTGGTLTCFDIDTEFIECADPTGCGLGPASLAWDFQACTEMGLNCSTNNVTDMFFPHVYNSSLYCSGKWGVQRRTQWFSTSMWGKDILSATNIIFSNGNLDPWSYGGVLKSLSDTLVAILIEGGAHHLDLRASNPADPPAVTAARQQERELIKKWISN